jgi:cell division protease FtsH
MDLFVAAEGLLEYETLTGDEIRALLERQEARSATWATILRRSRGSVVPRPAPRAGPSEVKGDGEPRAMVMPKAAWSRSRT